MDRNGLDTLQEALKGVSGEPSTFPEALQHDQEVRFVGVVLPRAEVLVDVVNAMHEAEVLTDLSPEYGYRRGALALTLRRVIEIPGYDGGGHLALFEDITMSRQR